MGRPAQIQTDILTALRDDLYEPMCGATMADIRIVVFGEGSDADKLRVIAELLA
jgi:hypothetical protein